MTLVPEKTRGFFQSRLPLILGIYILIQPLLDALTTPTAKAGMAISVGVVVRTLFMAFAFLYVVFVSRFKEKKWALIYLGAVVVYLVIFLVLMLSMGGLSQAIGNVKELVKVFFVPFVAVFLYAVYKEHSCRISPRAMTWACGLYAFNILFAFLTKTSGVSYPNSGYGYKGWFYAGNEVGCIIAIAAPVAIWFCLKQLPGITKKTWWKGVLIALTLFSITFAANYIGTKIIFAVVLVYCLAALVWCLVRAVCTRARWDLIRLAVMVLMVALMAVLFLRSPLNGYMDNVYNDLQDTSTEDILDKWSPDTEEPEDTEDGVPSSNLQIATSGTWLREMISTDPVFQKLDALLSRRLIIAAAPVQEFIDGSFLIKLFGIGYANSPAYDRNVGRLIELDGVSILVRQGILGAILYLLPYLAAIVYAIVAFFKKPLKRLSSLRYCSCLFSTLVAFAIAMVAGHVLGAPAVGTFMLVVTVEGLILTREQDAGKAEDL